MPFLKKIKEKIVEVLPPKLYWNLAGRFNPLSAAIQGQKDDQKFYKLGNYELNLFLKLKVIKNCDWTLEIGCGPGRIQKALAQSKLNLKVYGTDFSPAMIRKARQNVPQGRFLVGNGKDLKNYQNSFFDLVYSFVVFQHMDEDIFESYLKECMRVLKKGGHLVFQIASAEGLKNYRRPRKHPWKLRRYTRNEIIRKLQRNHFKEVKVYNMNAQLNPRQVDESGLLFSSFK